MAQKDISLDDVVGADDLQGLQKILEGQVSDRAVTASEMTDRRRIRLLFEVEQPVKLVVY